MLYDLVASSRRILLGSLVLCFVSTSCFPEDPPPIREGLFLSYRVREKVNCRLDFEKDNGGFAIKWSPRGCPLRPTKWPTAEKLVVDGYFEKDGAPVAFGEFGLMWLPRKFRKKGAYKGPDGYPLRITEVRKYQRWTAAVASKKIGAEEYTAYYDVGSGLLVGVDLSVVGQESQLLKLEDAGAP